MTIELKKLTLVNFKGIKDLSIDFDKQTTIFGDNATGKTTVFDAFIWLFFGKDSSDRKDFNIKTLNPDGRAIEKLDHEVSGILTVDGDTVELRRVFKEKWVKNKGKEKPEFSGHETTYFWNDVPCSQAEYNAKVNKILDEKIFKLITNALYFNSLKWQERRAVLFEIAGNIGDAEIVQEHPQFENLILSLSKGKSLAEFKREIGSKKKRLKDELAAIPTRIDELNRNLPVAADYPMIEMSIKQYVESLNDYDNKINDRSLAHQQQFATIQEQQLKVSSLKTRQNQIVHDLKLDQQRKASDGNLKGSQLRSNVQNIEADIKSKTLLLQSKTDLKASIDKKLVDLRAEFTKERDRELVFDNDAAFCCPTCKRALAADDVANKKQLMIDNFQTDKNKNLDEINTRGKNLSAELEDCNNLIKTLETALKKLQEDYLIANSELQVYELGTKENAESPADSIEAILESHDEYQKLSSQIAGLEAKIKQPDPLDVSDLRSKKAEIQERIDELKAQLSTKDIIEKSKVRIKELTIEENDYAQQLAELEGVEFQIDEFNKIKIDTIESRINGKFQYVEFKMFDTQINGGEAETCETMVNGVPYSDLNNAMKINSGLDIINTLCKHYGVNAPCFIDNAESITQIIPIESQTIRLVVSESHKQLKVA